MNWGERQRTQVKVTPPTLPEPGLQGMLAMIREDIEAVRGNDPAARDRIEILTSYPGLHAIWMHRVAHALWGVGMTTRARMVSNLTRAITGVEIHPGAVLGRRVFIDHGMGVVIGETAVVGDDCLIYKGVVLGGTSLERTKRHPTLGAGVVVGSNACILGRVMIGDGAKVGSCSVVIRDMPAGATAVGVPGRIVSTTESHGPLDHGDLPDPIATVLRALLEQVEGLSERIEALEGVQSADHREEEAELRAMRAELAAVIYEDFGD